MQCIDTPNELFSGLTKTDIVAHCSAQYVFCVPLPPFLLLTEYSDIDSPVEGTDYSRIYGSPAAESLQDIFYLNDEQKSDVADGGRSVEKRYKTVIRDYGLSTP